MRRHGTLKHILFGLIYGSIALILNSCNRKEIRYEYYDNNEAIVRSKGEYSNGKLDGLLAIFDRKGNIIEVGIWKDNNRHGLSKTYYPNGKIAAEYNFINGKAVGYYKLYYESGVLKKSSAVDETGFPIDSQSFYPDGIPKEMEPYFSINSDTLNFGDTVKIRGTLLNVKDKKYYIGSMIIGDKFNDMKKFELADTIAFVSSSLNYYELQIVPDKKGALNYGLTIVNKFGGYDTERNQNIDTVDFFGLDLRLFVK